jgi:hydrogenase maturation protein HypF
MTVSRETFNPPDILVMTSANPKNEPIVASYNQVKAKLNKVIDYTLDHNREIESRCDDSIVFNYKGPVIIRRSRGYVPEPVFLKNIKLKPVIAFGSDYKNHFALGVDNKVYLSPYIGDLTSSPSIEFLYEMLEKYSGWLGIKPKVVACDLHPDYTSRRIAEEYAVKNNLPLIKIQHHYAHLAGVMAENGLISRIIGVGFDGTGYGTDGNIWGSEIMVLDYSGFERISHLRELPLIGGDTDITNPKQIAQTYLGTLDLSATQKLITHNLRTISHTTSMGRLFDAVASILGICHKQTFEGEAPIALQYEAMKARTGNSKFQVPSSNFLHNGLIDTKPIIEEVIQLKKQGVCVSDVALIFHNRIIEITTNIVKNIAKQTRIKNVCLSGGVFQNSIVLKGVFSNLEKSGMSIFMNRAVPINDGGISFGQAVLAGKN